MAKRLLPNDVEVSNEELAKRQRAEAAEQSNIDAELLKEKQDPNSGDEDDNGHSAGHLHHHHHHHHHQDEDEDQENTAAAAAAAAAVYGGLMNAQEDPNNELQHQHHHHQLPHHHNPHDPKAEDEDDESASSMKDDDDDGRSGGSAAAAARRGRKPVPVTGSDEWRQQRKDSHKEVERRRRENINSAINKLSDLLPVKESSKASILLRAAEYIQKLRDTENANIEKWTLQKLLSEQQVSTLTKSNESLQLELGNAFKQVDILKRQLRNSGISIDPEVMKLESEANRNN
ncbi:LANO_0F15324g1_1 [Lachancea nothofagi CBS 11611]|uniref:LANO_0F15324g1_1 n=1 Tax=Lachancea nothofagi CBS 11611 TaxID=1266666 RepID=A0A1G4KCP0_9SACH|nr:LANO_0F15324g1_1 [Lachancea nothofagi CBS 11611]